MRLPGLHPDQYFQLQLNELVRAGVQKRDVFAVVTSGSETAIEGPGMKRLLEYAEEGDIVVVWRVDRLGRPLIDVLNTVALLRGRRVHVRSISQGRVPVRYYRGMAMNLRVPEDLDRRLEKLAAEEHTSKSALLLQGAELVLQRHARRREITEGLDFVMSHDADLLKRLEDA